MIKSLLTAAIVLVYSMVPLAEAPAAHAYVMACPQIFGNGFYPYSAPLNDHTSCPFAEQVRAAYITQVPGVGRFGNVVAYSPVTGSSYVMTCAPTTATTMDGYSHPGVNCFGGNDAAVALY